MERKRRIKAFSLIAVMFVMMGHNIIPHHHDLHHEDHSTDFVHTHHHHDHSHDEMHTHDHHHEPGQSAEKNTSGSQALQAGFLEGKAGTTHAHQYTTTKANPVRRIKSVDQSDMLVPSGNTMITSSYLVQKRDYSPYVPPLISIAADGCVSLRAPPMIS